MRYAVLVSVQIKPHLKQEIAAGHMPRRDYLDLSDALNAQLINTSYVPPRGGLIAIGLLQAWNAFKRRDSYDVIITDSDHAGIALALLFKMTRTQKRHIMISHWLTPAKKVVFFRKLHIQTHIDKIITYSTRQQRVALDVLKLPPHKVERVLHPADHLFWKPLGSPKQSMICSAGLEFRDYSTLTQAVSGLNVQVEIAAASPWSQRPNFAENVPLPPNVHVGKRSYFQLSTLR